MSEETIVAGLKKRIPNWTTIMLTSKKKRGDCYPKVS
jgi:hypothetical protein